MSSSGAGGAGGVSVGPVGRDEMKSLMPLESLKSLESCEVKVVESLEVSYEVQSSGLKPGNASRRRCGPGDAPTEMDGQG
jgi:hypothetical protein